MAVERTLILFKPDAVQRRLCGKLLARIEDRGLRIVGLKMLQVTPELAKKHYAEHVSKPFYPHLESFIISGPIVALAVEGPDAIKVMRETMGKTNSREAGPGTIRGDYSVSRQMNLIHGSDGPEAAARELTLYFQPSELFSWTSPMDDLMLAPDEK
jgi:nucleoside-diphosphate kinase